MEHALSQYVIDDLHAEAESICAWAAATHQRDLLDLGFDPEDCIEREQRILRATAHLNDERMIVNDVRAVVLHRADSPHPARPHRLSVADPAGQQVRRYWSRAAKRERERVLFWRRARFLGVCVVASVLLAWAVQAVMWAAW